MRVINIHEAKTTLSKLIARVQRGDEILIGKAGHPVARLSPYDAAEKPRVPGLLKGKLRIGEDFDALPARTQAAFRNPSL